MRIRQGRAGCTRGARARRTAVPLQEEREPNDVLALPVAGEDRAGAVGFKGAVRVWPERDAPGLRRPLDGRGGPRAVAPHGDKVSVVGAAPTPRPRACIVGAQQIDEPPLRRESTRFVV